MFYDVCFGCLALSPSPGQALSRPELFNASFQIAPVQQRQKLIYLLSIIQKKSVNLWAQNEGEEEVKKFLEISEPIISRNHRTARDFGILVKLSIAP